ncbi:MAG: hypothetical protein KFB97_04765 [Cyanobium sp. M30B3]|jgi:hypothetical protein|nr:MAG: hypothetical protein KFB97_04765 [Cyanobium sp. M30B3]
MDLSFLIERATHQPPPQPSQQRWLERRETWLRELEQLSRQVQQWLKEAGVSAAAFQPYQEARNEEWIGSYLVNCWLVDIGSFRLRFDPRGTLMVGACGRVDIRSSQAGTPVVKLIAEEGDRSGDPWRWSIYCDEAGLDDLELNPENLAQALSLLMPEG